MKNKMLVFAIALLTVSGAVYADQPEKKDTVVNQGQASTTTGSNGKATTDATNDTTKTKDDGKGSLSNTNESSNKKTSEKSIFTSAKDGVVKYTWTGNMKYVTCTSALLAAAAAVYVYMTQEETNDTDVL